MSRRREGKPIRLIPSPSIDKTRPKIQINTNYQRIKWNDVRCIHGTLGTQQEQDFHLQMPEPPEFPAAQPRAPRENRANTYLERSNLWRIIWRSRVPQRVDSNWDNLFRVLQTYDRTQDERLKPGEIKMIYYPIPSASRVKIREAKLKDKGSDTYTDHKHLKLRVERILALGSSMRGRLISITGGVIYRGIEVRNQDTMQKK